MTNFPDHNINPKSKDKDWIRQYIKAAYEEFTTSNLKIFYNNRQRYKEIKDYVMGKQSVSKYQKTVTGEDGVDSSWANIDWTVRPVADKLRAIAISKLIQKWYNITATPVDALAKDENEKYYAEHKAKIQIREEMMKVNPEMANMPILQKQPGEPEDLEELEMMMNLGVKLKVAMEAEMGIDYVFYKNGFKNLRKSNLESMFDYGVGGYKEWVDENGEVRVRDVDPAHVIVSFCKKADFSDARYIGELTDMAVGDLPFDKDTRKKIAETVNKNSPSERNWAFNTSYDKEKVQVLDMEFFSYDEKVYEQREIAPGNVVTKRTSYDRYSDRKTHIGGQMVNQYIKKPIKTVYTGKWVVGTDYIFDADPSTYQKRSKPNKAETFLSYHLYAYNFHEMRCLSKMETLIPVIDEYHNTIYKVQNFKNKWVPYIINLDLQAMENVALGSGGEAMNPKEILELVFQNFTALGRRMDVSGQMQNYKMVDIETTGMSQEYTVLVNDLARLLQEMRDMIGLNDLTDGSTPGERTLNGVASLANDATNNALYPITYADRCLTESLAKGVILRLVQTVQDRDVEGITRTLGDETVKFIRVTKDISDRVWDIKLEDRPSEQQKEMLLQQLEMKEGQGMITPEDKILLIQTNNLKQFLVILAHRIKRRQKEMQQEQLMMIQENGRGQQESAVVTAEEERKTMTLKADLELRNEMAIKEKEMEMLGMKLEAQNHATETGAATKIVTEEMRSQKQSVEKTS